jgi:hypothetical protein
MNQVFKAVGYDVQRRSVDGIFIARLGLDAFALSPFRILSISSSMPESSLSELTPRMRRARS